MKEVLALDLRRDAAAHWRSSATFGKGAVFSAHPHMNTKLLSSILLTAAFAVSVIGFIAGLSLAAFIVGASAMLVTILAHDYQQPQYCGLTVRVSNHALPLAA